MKYTSAPILKRTLRFGTVILAGATLFVLVLSAPASLRDAYDRGGFYLFSHALSKIYQSDWLAPVGSDSYFSLRWQFFWGLEVASLMPVAAGLPTFTECSSARDLGTSF
jgi:hypothetical protein